MFTFDKKKDCRDSGFFESAAILSAHDMRHNKKIRSKRFLTKRAMSHLAFRIKLGDRDLLRTAAAREEISQSDFVRMAISERARRILLLAGEQVVPGREAE